ERESEGSLPGSRRPIAAPASELPDTRAQDPPIPGDHEQHDPPVARSAYEGYLERKGRTAEAFAAVYDLTEDEGVLREALESFPDCAPLLARGAWLSNDPAFALQCAEALRRVEPDASLGDYLTAMLLAKQGGDPEAIRNAMTLALSKGPPEPHDREGISARREAMESA